MKRIYAEDYYRRLEKGKSIGIKDEYIPIFSYNEVTSYGRKSKIKTWLRKKPYEVLSDLERSCLLQHLWDDNVFDIREQYPLDPVKVINICKKNNLDMPVANVKGEKKVKLYTIDFLITYKDDKNNYSFKAINCKYNKMLKHKFIQNTMQIEKLYFNNEKNTEWVLFTEKDINKVLVSNIKHMFPFYSHERFESLSSVNIIKFKEFLTENLTEKKVELTYIIESFMLKHNFSYNEVITLLYHCIMKKYIQLDITNNDIRKPQYMNISKENLTL